MAVDSSDGQRDHMPVFGGTRDILHGSMQKVVPPSGPLVHPTPPTMAQRINMRERAQAPASTPNVHRLGPPLPTSKPSTPSSAGPPPTRPLPVAKSAKPPKRNKNG